MGTRIKVGDIFEVPLGSELKGYLQYIGKDSTQLNCQVLRVFKQKYPKDILPALETIVSGEIDFHVHVLSITSGVNDGIWVRIGNISVRTTNDVLFRDTHDYGSSKELVSNNWHVWYLSKEWKKISPTSALLPKSDIGITLLDNNEIIKKMISNSYSFWYPKYPGEK